MGDLNTDNAKSVFNGSTLAKQKQSNEDAKSDSPLTKDESGKTLKQRLEELVGSPWPHRQTGYLDFTLITPTLKTSGNPTNPDKPLPIKMTYSEDYKFKDWRGQLLQDGPNWPNRIIETKDRFKANRKLPKSNSELAKSPHSMRDVPLIFNDVRYDYFRFGLQTLDDLTPIENPKNGKSNLRLDSFSGTPWEQSDPVYYGFDIVFDSVSSPLLNGAVSDFINNYSTISEIGSKKQVYEEFKNQFSKFFRTNAPIKVDPDYIRMTSTGINKAKLNENTSLNQPGKQAYFAYYIKKITGLDLLIESNKGTTMKYIPKYREDMISIDMTEDITLSLGTLIHLYKMLYWSKPNGKALIPDNLLRFNCDIIISECRNMNRVRKEAASGNIEVVKDNLSRWVYSLRDCQFYFDKIPVSNDIDMGSEPKQFDTNVINFDFKFSSVALERFVPVGDWGTYYSYNSGSIWKIGNSGTRDSRNGGASSENSIPKFFDIDVNSSNQNGVKVPYVVSIYGDSSKNERRNSSVTSLDVFKDQSDKNSKDISESISNKTTELKTSNLKPGQVLTNAMSSNSVKKANNIVSNPTPVITVGKTPTSQTKGTKNSNFFDVSGQLFGNNPMTARQILINNTINKLYLSITGIQKPRFAPNTLNGLFPQGNIKYVNKMNPPVVASLSRYKGYESPGDLYIFQVSKFAGGPLSNKIFSNGL